MKATEKALKESPRSPKSSKKDHGSMKKNKKIKK